MFELLEGNWDLLMNRQIDHKIQMSTLKSIYSNLGTHFDQKILSRRFWSSAET